MTALTWHKGPPPHVGWWLCKVHEFKPYWRWHNSEHWSRPASHEMSGFFAALAAETKVESCYIAGIEWSWYWPENACVARINPETGDCTGSGPIPLSAIEQWARPDLLRKQGKPNGYACSKCGGVMRPGQAIVTSAKGSHDLGGICTMSPDPKASKMIECSKCASCGHSVSNGGGHG